MIRKVMESDQGNPGKKGWSIRGAEVVPVETGCYISKTDQSYVYDRQVRGILRVGSSTATEKRSGVLQEQGDNRILVQGTVTGGEKLFKHREGVYLKCL